MFIDTQSTAAILFEFRALLYSSFCWLFQNFVGIFNPEINQDGFIFYTHPGLQVKHLLAFLGHFLVKKIQRNIYRTGTRTLTASTQRPPDDGIWSGDTSYYRETAALYPPIRFALVNEAWIAITHGAGFAAGVTSDALSNSFFQNSQRASSSIASYLASTS